MTTPDLGTPQARTRVPLSQAATREPVAHPAAAELLVARFGELWLKGRNRALFARTLKRNTRLALRGFDGVRIQRLHGQLVLRVPARREEVLARLSQVFGFSSLSVAWQVPAAVEPIAALAPEVVGRALESHAGGEPVDFRVTARRADKRFPVPSPELGRQVADSVLARHGERLRVRLKQAALDLQVVVRPEGAYLFVERRPGAGGLPVGSLGRVVCLLSGGIDSPVAAWLAMKRGCHVSLVSFHSSPWLGERSREKIRRQARVLARYQRASRLFSVPFPPVQEAIRDAAPESYRTVLYRRMMQRIAGRIARREHAPALVTGESVGQVASQTLENLRCIEEASELCVLRPLIASDKQETITLARRIGTYDISCSEGPDCCTVFQPREPVTRGSVWRCREAEAALDVEGLVAGALAGTELEVFEA